MGIHPETSQSLLAKFAWYEPASEIHSANHGSTYDLHTQSSSWDSIPLASPTPIVHPVGPSASSGKWVCAITRGPEMPRILDLAVPCPFSSSYIFLYMGGVGAELGVEFNAGLDGWEGWVACWVAGGSV
jgi:hypothetical protein